MCNVFILMPFVLKSCCCVEVSLAWDDVFFVPALNGLHLDVFQQYD